MKNQGINLPDSSAFKSHRKTAKNGENVKSARGEEPRPESPA